MQKNAYPQPKTCENEREQKAIDLTEIAGAIRVNPDGSFQVSSQWSPGKSYRVVLTGIPTCECGDFVYRQVECKHIIAAKAVQRQNDKSAGQVKRCKNGHIKDAFDLCDERITV